MSTHVLRLFPLLREDPDDAPEGQITNEYFIQHRQWMLNNGESCQPAADDEHGWRLA
jgi:hypothetical protein